MRGLFAIFMIVDCRAMSVSLESIRSQLMDMGKKIGLELASQIAIQEPRATWFSAGTNRSFRHWLQPAVDWSTA